MTSMQWEEALAAVKRTEMGSSLVVHALTYRYLAQGPERLAARECSLRRWVSSLPAGIDLPTRLGRKLLAWEQATTMAHRRLVWDLPQSWPGIRPGPG